MPALNEQAGIAATIGAIPLTHLFQAGYSVEILVVDGGSRDATVSLARKAGARVIASPRGYGTQYQCGFKEARGEFIVTGDSDGTYPFEDALRYIHALEQQKLDFVSVNRFAHMEQGAMPLVNKMGNRLLTLCTNVLFQLSLRDSQSGMWIIRRTVLSQLRAPSCGMSFSQELKIEAFTKVRSAELPGRYKVRLGETKLIKWKDGCTNMLHLFRKRLSF